MHYGGDRLRHLRNTIGYHETVISREEEYLNYLQERLISSRTVIEQHEIQSRWLRFEYYLITGKFPYVRNR